MIEHPALIAAVRHGLTSALVVKVDALDTLRVLGDARYDHTASFLADAALAGVVVFADTQAVPQLCETWHEELSACVQLEALTVRTALVLDRASVTWRLTKGAALAHRDYDNPSLRTFGDVDIVVHPSDWGKAFAALAGHGFERKAGTLPGGYDERYGKGATLTTAEQLELDLHRRFAIGRFAVRSRMEDVFSSGESITLAGRDIPVLDGASRLLHVCFHAMLGRGHRLRVFRDIAQLLLVTGADWEKTFEIARSWRAEAVVAAAIRETWDRLELTLEHPAHERALATEISTKDARVLEQFPLMPFRKQALTALPRLPPYEIPRYLWALSAGQRRRVVTRTAASASRRRSG